MKVWSRYFFVWMDIGESNPRFMSVVLDNPVFISVEWKETKWKKVLTVPSLPFWMNDMYNRDSKETLLYWFFSLVNTKITFKWSSKSKKLV